MRLEFNGRLSFGNEYRTNDDDATNGAVFIDGSDVVASIAESDWDDDSAEAYLNGVKVAKGKAVTSIGWGYSEYTPVDEDVVQIGGFDLLKALLQLKEGEVVSLIIQDKDGE